MALYYVHMSDLLKYNTIQYKYLKDLVKDLCENRCHISMFIGDNPKRAEAREALQHSSLYACEYCFMKGSIFKNCDKETRDKIVKLSNQKGVIDRQIEKLVEEEEDVNEDDIADLICVRNELKQSITNLMRKKSHIVWPSSTIGGEPRTKEKINEIISKLNEAPLERDEAKGITGKSVFLDLDYFDIVLDIPAEYLHSTCLGTIKRTVELTFNVGTNRQRITKRKLSDPTMFNALMALIKVPREFPRRVRSLDFSVMKGQEFRNLGLFFFIVIIECIEPNEKERRLWLLLSYMLRVSILPQKEFQRSNVNVISYCSESFYKLFEKLFGSGNCTYNTHIVGSHFIEMRRHGPLTLSSAFGFENFYGELRNSFAPGTISPIKQIFEQVLIKREIGPHSCAPSITYTNYTTPLECNNLIYTFYQNTYHFYKIVEIEDGEEDVSCIEIEKENAHFEETPNLDWDKVGVFIKSGEKEEIVKIKKKNIEGKLIEVMKYIMTCPINVLEEK